MTSVFADTGYYIALLNPNDNLHRLAIEVSEKSSYSHTVTSEMVLAELLNYFARRGSHLRGLAAKVVQELLNDPNVSVKPQTSVLFRTSFEMYLNREDKAWTLTDCASFCLMREFEIEDVYSHDIHFEQAGFRPILR